MKAILYASLFAGLAAAKTIPVPRPRDLSGIVDRIDGLVSWATRAAVTGHPYDGAVVVPNQAFVDHVANSTAILRAAKDPFADKLATVANFSPFVWIADSDAADKVVPDTLAAARKAYLSGQTGGKPPMVQFVIYDLPDRDCSAGASSGEFHVNQDGLKKYKKYYIDRIARAFDAYPDVRIVAVIEPDALPNLVTNSGSGLCATAKSTYIAGLQYAVQKLQSPNVALYMDSGSSNWIGWGDNQVAAAALLKDILAGVPNNATIRGVSINVSNYGPNIIPGIKDFSDPALGALTWNPGYDNLHFAQTYGQKLAANGVPNKFLIDTARNGVYLPTTNWCNLKGAGFGERPGKATGDFAAAGVDAFGWIKTPGESDGTSDPASPRYVANCAAADSVTPAPEAGLWFHDYFVALGRNAVPAL